MIFLPIFQVPYLFLITSMGQKTSPVLLPAISSACRRGFLHPAAAHVLRRAYGQGKGGERSRTPELRRVGWLMKVGSAIELLVDNNG